MNFNKHYDLRGAHAFLSPSQPYWLNYDDEKLVRVYSNYTAKERGTRLHAFAEECINLGQKLPRSQTTLNMYVNDAINYAMTPEQVLYYSDNCFGTADSICFRRNFLRIHDLKTGVIPAHMEQLMVYEALFCLEYHIKPGNIRSELRIYQNDEVTCYIPEADEILPIMDKIIAEDKILNELEKSEEGNS
jgi:hypothetical protein